MDLKSLRQKFLRIGSRLEVVDLNDQTFAPGTAILNVLEDGDGEFFTLAIDRQQAPEVTVLDVQPADRHLLLMTRNGRGDKRKFLCGFDEKGFFAAAIPEVAPVGNVQQAKEALKPPEVQARQVGLKAKFRSRRRNPGFYLRQGEWFFTPADIPEPPAFLVLKNEPISRGDRSKPHFCGFLFRTGGTQVWVCHRHPTGVSQEEHDRIIKDDPAAKRWRWQAMTKNAEIYVKGSIRHADHKVLVLKGWHRVFMNTEARSRARRQLAFLD
jgi:hypothetical protein